MRRIFSFCMPTLLLSLVIQIPASFLLWLVYLPIVGQVQAAAPITQSGLNTQVSPPIISGTGANQTTQYNITGGTRPGGGTNLFHSFGDFNVPNNNIANFLNDSGLNTSNILGRVTGGNVSNIFGTIQTQGFGSANLFLMNPAGFLFGPNATINVGGMVAFTSADYLRFQGNQTLFNNASTPESLSPLSIAPVAAFGFLGSNPGAITVQGSQLSVTPGQSISLVGGNITVQSGTLDNGTVQSANLSAPGGQISLASVASPGEILTGTLAQAPNINGQSFGNLGAVQITEQSVIDVSGNGGGTVLIRGGNFVLDNSTISANVTGPGPVVNGAESVGGGIDIQVAQDVVIQNAAVLETNVSGNATPGVQYGGIHVKANTIEIIGSQDFDNFPFTGIRSDISEGSTGGNSGNITLEGNSILVQDLGTFTTIVETTTAGAGNAGNIVLTANNNLTLDGATIQSLSQSSPGNGGNISLSSTHGDIVMTNGTFIVNDSTSGSGNTGTISLDAQGNISIDASLAALIATDSFSGSGNAGNIAFTSREGNISMTGGPTILSTTFSSTGIAGNIIVNALAGDVLISGGDLSGSLGTSLRPPAGQNPSAPGSGAIEVNARNLTIHNTAISSDNLFSPVVPGNITINLSGTLNLSGTFTDVNGAVIHSLIQTTSRGPARSADVNITAHDVQVSDGAAISTEAFSSGNAGIITIHTQNLEVTSGGQVRSGTTQVPGLPIVSGAGGAITVQGPNGPAASVLIDGSGSGLFTNTQGTGAGGNINVSTQSLTVQNGGTLSAATSGTAPSATGGTITVNANTVTLTSGGTMTVASTGAGASGEVVVQGLASPAQSILIDGAGSGIFTDTHGTGVGGDIHLSANSVTLQNGGMLSAATSGSDVSATGGTITVIAPGQMAMTGGSSISASSSGPANAGDISINAGQQLTMQNSSITTEASQASGGNITIQAVELVGLATSTISASVLGGPQTTGGNITIDPNLVILQNSQITANAVQGNGGNISLTTNFLIVNNTLIGATTPVPASAISASSQFGQNGTITVQSPNAPASGKIIPLSQKPLLATSLLNQRCASLAGGKFSSFTVAGRDSLPTEPGSWLASPLALGLGGTGSGPVADKGERAGIDDDPARETPILSLRQIAPAGFLTQAFAVDWSAGCQS